MLLQPWGRHLALMKNRACANVLVLIALAGTATPLQGASVTLIDPPSPAPAMAATDPDGRQHRLAELAGKVVLVNFWASWCAPCLKEMPSMQRLADDLSGDGLRVLAVNVGEDARRAVAMASRVGYRGTVLLDPDRALFSAWGVDVLPTSVLVDHRGRLRMRLVGETDWDDPSVRERLGGLLNESRRPTD
jgi:thiol-disulfide isomerase/thioredoxin